MPNEDMDLGSKQKPPRVAQYAGPDYGWASELDGVLKAARRAWERLPTIELSEASMPSRWKSLSAFLVDTESKDKFDFATKPLGEARKEAGGIEAAKNAPVRYPKKRPDVRSLSDAFRCNDFEYAVLLARKLVNGLVCTQVGKASLQLSLPTVNAADLNV